MPEFNVKAIQSGDPVILREVAGEKYPEGTSYTIPAPSAHDELLMRRLTHQQDQRDAAELAKDKRKQAKISAEIAGLYVALCDDGKGGLLDFDVKMLGTAHAQMTADGVRPSLMDKYAQLVLTNYGVNEGVARLVIKQAEGEAEARANRAAPTTSAPVKPRSSTPKAGSRSRQGSGVSSTRKAPAATRGRARSSVSTAKTA